MQSRSLFHALGIAWLLTLASFAAGQTLKDPALQVREVVAGLSLPTTMAFIGPRDLLVLQKNDGRVCRVLEGVLQPGEVLDVAVEHASERGLLGIAVHPRFPGTPFVYLSSTESSTGADTSRDPRRWGTVSIASRGTEAPSTVRPCWWTCP